MRQLIMTDIPLLTFKLILRSDGQLITDTENVDMNEFVQVMDRWQPEYEHTLTFVMIMRHFKRELRNMEDDIARLIKQ